MEMPSYDGIIDAWKVKLIIQRAKRHKLKPHEIPDVLQEAVLAILDTNHDSGHASGATERTLLIAIVDKLIQKIKRTDQRYRMHVERLGKTASEFSREEIDIQALDVTEIMEKLNPQEKAVCHALAEGMSKAQMAKRLNCGWREIDRIIQSLRQHFKEWDLDEEVMPDANNRFLEIREIR